MHRFASGWKKSYYGKGDVTVYRLHRDPGKGAVFGANVLILIFGEAFWPSYTAGDNTNLVATDSMKNFIQRETMNFRENDLESYCRFLAERFMATYPQTEGAQVTASEIPYAQIADNGDAFAPVGPERAWARIETGRGGVSEVRSGIAGFRLLRVNGSAFKDFVRDQYTTLPDIANRPLHMWLDLDWSYVSEANAFSEGAITKRVSELVREVFDSVTSGSIQQIIYEMGTNILAELPTIAEVNLEANNRTWDTIVEGGESVGIYTDARPPYGCIGLSLRR